MIIQPNAIDSQDTERKRRILKADYRFPDKYFASVSDEAVDLIKTLLQRDPLRRPSTEEVLSHAWMQGPAGSLASGPSLPATPLGSTPVAAEREYPSRSRSLSLS